MTRGIRIVAFLGYALFVGFISLRPMGSASLAPWDKVFHLIIYGIFAVIGYRLLNTPRQYLYICIGIVVYSGILEILQSFMPGRVMSAYDLLANVIGVFLGAFFASRVFAVSENL